MYAYAYEYANENEPWTHHMNCAHCVLYPTNYTKEIHSIEQILVLMVPQHKLTVGLVLMAMLIPYIYDIPDYCQYNDARKGVRYSGYTIQKRRKKKQLNTHCRYFSSEDFSRNGMPDKNKIINVVNSGDKMPTHSIPRMTLIEITKMPHQMRISPK